ncbi:hypothetical protein [Rhodococcoides yunnanense]|uniref:hypothetical protein n=1 Tax=Rhodococcoides yunnanense TaxID=278209 RepID=UPI0012E24E6E|nr:hypothetical protein [Rhodococcus yunnanensis]
MAQCTSDARAWRDGTAYRAHGRRVLGGRARATVQPDDRDAEATIPMDTDGVEPV